MKSGKKMQVAVLAAVLALCSATPVFAAATDDIDAQIVEQEKILEAFLLILGGFTLGAIILSKTMAVAEDLDKQELNSYKEAVQGLYPTFSSIQPADDMDYRTTVFVKSDTVRQIVLRDKNIQHKLYCCEVEKNSPDDTYHFTRSYMRDDRTYPIDAPKKEQLDATPLGLYITDMRWEKDNTVKGDASRHEERCE